MGKLYVIPTPVGNLEDMTYRAVRLLGEVDLILAEDTRTSSVLLQHYGIHNSLQSHHKFNEHQTASAVVGKLKSGMNICHRKRDGRQGWNNSAQKHVPWCSMSLLIV